MMKTETVLSKTLCRAYNLGIIEYGKAMKLQDNLVAARLAGDIPDTLLIQQHFPVITVGASGKAPEILFSKDFLERKGISVYQTDRGGSVTFHGPGQLVGYPIFDLRNRGRDVHQYVRNLEEVVIRTLAVFLSQPASTRNIPASGWEMPKFAPWAAGWSVGLPNTALPSTSTRT